MAEHSELITEMVVVEKMSTQERLKHAKKRRQQQLKKWSQHERDLQKGKLKSSNQGKAQGKGRPDYKVHFVPSVMLLEAAARNDVDEVRRLLMLGVSPDSTNEDGLTALHQCCIDDSEEMMKLLIDYGANVNAKDSEQWTPLHAAATCGHIHLVRYLISKGADLLAVNADGNMPYDICEDEPTLDYIESEMAKRGITQEMIDETRAANEVMMLKDLRIAMESGLELEFRDEQGATPLHIASANGYVSVVEFLLDQHASTDVVDNDQWQPIHAAACWGHPDVLEMLVQAGADLNARTKNGETPYDICEDPDLKERIMQLRSEMETKRAMQPQKLRRTQSQNTRSQSVRRTSIREKVMISRREAREEARMWQEQTHGKEEHEAKLQRDIHDSEKSQMDGTPVDDSASSIASSDPVLLLPPAAMDAPVVQVSPSHRTYGNGDSLTASLPAIPLPPPSYAEVSPLPPRSQGEAVKVEIHVTVNTTNPQQSTVGFSPQNGTLSDLKKHRADKRNSRSSLTLSTTQQQDLLGKMASAAVGQNGHHFSATLRRTTYDEEMAMLPPPSPTTSLRRFRSDPSEIVGEAQKKGCCSLM
ncbi:protein phosphatase 1 regulatory subunit 16A-like [Ornithodoros turicata]|uniref:protein phosphatase 1 regulatory subunit 16A-like n=1 Tax=Ornithodoros turicata TaxID=34597 RepID=UPI00313A1FD5